MSKEEFLSQLENQLSGIPENDKQEALQYYRDYFEDAGKEKEREVLEALGSPADVAKNIREENRYGEYTESGYRTDTVSSGSNMLQPQNNGYGSNGGYGQNSGYGPNGGCGQNNGYSQNAGNNFNNSNSNAGKKDDQTGIIVAIVLIVLLSPLWIPLVGSILGVIVGFIGAVFGFAVAGVLMFIGSIIAFVGSIIAMIAGVPVPIGIMIMGIGLIVGALGLLVILLTVLFFRYAVPAIFKGIQNLWGMIFKKKEASR